MLAVSYVVLRAMCLFHLVLDCIRDNMWCVQSPVWAYEHPPYIQEVLANMGAELPNDWYASN